VYAYRDRREYLTRWPDKTASALVRLELALARARRGVEFPHDENAWRLARGVELVELPRGTVALRAAVLQRLDGSAERIVDGDVDFEPQLESGLEHFLVRRERDAALRLESLTPELFRLLQPIAQGSGWGALCESFREMELSEAEGVAILEEFVDSGELIRPAS